MEKNDRFPDFITVGETETKWQVSVRQVQMYCKRGILKGAFKLGNNWVIPADCSKPVYRFVSVKNNLRNDENE